MNKEKFEQAQKLNEEIEKIDSSLVALNFNAKEKIRIVYKEPEMGTERELYVFEDNSELHKFLVDKIEKLKKEFEEL